MAIRLVDAIDFDFDKFGRTPAMVSSSPAFFVSENPAHRGDLAHFDRMAVDAGQDAAQRGDILGADEVLPVVEVGEMRLATYTCA